MGLSNWLVAKKLIIGIIIKTSEAPHLINRKGVIPFHYHWSLEGRPTTKKCTSLVAILQVVRFWGPRKNSYGGS
jgi:hypothetical protein